jgi:hypothetical protein
MGARDELERRVAVLVDGSGRGAGLEKAGHRLRPPVARRIVQRRVLPVILRSHPERARSVLIKANPKTKRAIPSQLYLRYVTIDAIPTIPTIRYGTYDT